MQQINLKIGNVLDKLKEIPDNSVDCVCTSPPYYGLRFYRAPDVIFGGDQACEHEWITQSVGLLHENRNNLTGTQEEVHNASGVAFIKKYDNLNAGKCSKCGAWKGQLGLEPDYRLYLDHLLMVTAELKRVLKPTGTLWWNMGDSYNNNPSNSRGNLGNGKALEEIGRLNRVEATMPSKSLMQLPTRFAIRMADEQGWILRNTMIWHKRNHMPISVKDAVKQVLEEVPAARYNEGLLAERVLRYFQPQGVEMQYDKDTQEITLKAPKALMLAVLRHIETIARRSREYREAHPFTESPKAQERGVEYAFSTKKWFFRSFLVSCISPLLIAISLKLLGFLEGDAVPANLTVHYIYERGY